MNERAREISERHSEVSIHVLNAKPALRMKTNLVARLKWARSREIDMKRPHAHRKALTSGEAMVDTLGAMSLDD